MRSKMIEITMKIPIMETDCNGNKYNIDSIKEAVTTMKDIPILQFVKALKNETNGSEIPVDNVVGHITNAKIEDDKIIADGILYFGGTCENGDIQDGIFNTAYFTSIGITQ